MWRRIRNLNFRMKLMLMFGILFIFIMGMGSVLYYCYMAENLKESGKSNAEEVVRQLYDTMESRIEAVDNRVHAMLINNTFVTTLANYLIQPTDERIAVTMGTVADFLKNLELGESVIHSVYIYTDEVEFDNFSLYRNWEFQFPLSQFYQVFQGNQRGKQWFWAMPDPIFQTRDLVVPCVWRFRVQGVPKDCFLVVQYSKKELDAILEGKEEFFDQIMVLDSRGKRIAGDGTFAAVCSDSLEIDGKHYMTISRQMPDTGWTIWCLKSQQPQLDDLSHIRKMIAGIAGGLCLICLGITWFLATRLTDSLRRLTQRMNCVTNGDLDTRFFYPYQDEVGSLAKSFNYMIGEMKGLIDFQKDTIEELKRERDYVAEIQKQKRKAELKALQAQINPHFLYNTLNTITWQAADQGAEEIARLSNLLGKFFRLTLRKGAEVITLREEAEHVRSYLDIQRIRYRDKIQYDIQISEQAMEAPVIKLILQPLVENSIYHGIKEKQGEGMIRVQAAVEKSGAEEYLILTVWDNGIGMEEEKIRGINQGLRDGITGQSEGYGIYNVNERIRIYYGRQYGLSFVGKPGMWTRAVVTLPFCSTDKGEMQDEPNIDRR